MIVGIKTTASSWRISSGTTVQRFMADERGATAIEFSLIAAVVCIPILAALTVVGTQTSALWSSVATKIVTAMG